MSRSRNSSGDGGGGAGTGHTGDGAGRTGGAGAGRSGGSGRDGELPPELTVGMLSQRSGVPVSALHFYERQGLLHSRRTAGNQRRFRRDALRRVAFIRAAQRVGMPLRTIKDALDGLGDDHTPTRREWAQLSQHWRGELDERIAQLEALRDRLDGCIGCGCLSIDRCTLVNPGDRLAAKGPGAPLLSPPAGAAPHEAGPSSRRRNAPAAR